MKDLFVLFLHLVTTVAKLLGPGGAVLAETLLVKHQLLTINRPRRRTTNLTVWDRVLIGLCLLFMNQLDSFKRYYNESRTHTSLDGNTPYERSGSAVLRPATFDNFTWEPHCGGLFQLPIAA